MRKTDRDVPLEAISLDDVQNAIEGGHKLKLIVLDACRDNPFASQMKFSVANRSIGRGLSPVEPSGATLVVYAAKGRRRLAFATFGLRPFDAFDRVVGDGVLLA